MVRTAQYKFIKNDKKHERRGGETELYDLTEDPLETNNLAKDPAYAGTLKELSAQLEAWQKDIPPVPVIEGLKPQASGDGSAPGEKQKKTDRKRKPALPS
jgi:arylsulfatase A-like enzyme